MSSEEMSPQDVMAAALMASAAREADSRKRMGHTQKVNELLEMLPPDMIIERLKGSLYRNLGVLEAWQKSEEANAGQDMLAAALFSVATTVGEALKWIAVHNGLNPYEPYGDDSYVIRVQDIVLGIEFSDDESEPGGGEESVSPRSKMKYNEGDDEL